MIAQYILAALFLFSGITKLSDLEGFYVTLVQYDIFKGIVAKTIAYITPFFEILIGLAFALNFYASYTAYSALLFMFATTALVAYALFKKKRIDNCGCYGTAIKVPVTKWKLVENLIWILLLIYLITAL